MTRWTGVQCRSAPTEVASIARATVVDDDADIGDLLCELLETLGHECVRFPSALPGLEELIASQPDLIVIDIGLHPSRDEQTGLQVIHAARSGMPLREVPIIVLASDPSRLTEAMPDLMARGDVHRLDKPFGLETFERVLEMALGRSKAGTDVAGHPLHALESGETIRDGDAGGSRGGDEQREA